MTDWSQVPIAKNYTDLFAHYGDPRNHAHFEKTYLTTYHLKLANGTMQAVQTHAAMVHRLDAVVAQAGSHIHTCAGSYNFRVVRGGTHLSLHSWGIAIDINADQFPLGSLKQQDAALVAAFADHGYFWGGNYHHRKDPMHWQLAGDF